MSNQKKRKLRNNHSKRRKLKLKKKTFLNRKMNHLAEIKRMSKRKNSQKGNLVKLKRK